jgi:hypothetical protein
MAVPFNAVAAAYNNASKLITDKTSLGERRRGGCKGLISASFSPRAFRG